MFLVKFGAAFATFCVQEANATSESLANEKKYFERHSESKVHRIYLNHSDAWNLNYFFIRFFNCSLQPVDKLSEKGPTIWRDFEKIFGLHSTIEYWKWNLEELLAR